MRILSEEGPVTNRSGGQRVVVLVSEDISDIYFANRILKRANVVGVVVEGQNAAGEPLLSKGLRYLKDPKLISGRVKEGLYGKKDRELAYRINYEGFGEDGVRLDAGAGIKVIRTEGVRAINAPEYVEEIKGLKPDVIAVCGTSILKKEIIAIPPKGVVNLHGGLAQWYRGVWTTLWAVYNREPEYVGATVHFISEGVDDGDVIYQGRPVISEDDDQETLYVKVVKLGIGLMLKALGEIEDGTVKRHTLTQKGRLYLGRQVTPEVVRKTWKTVREGAIRDYLNGPASKKKIEIYE